MLQSITAKQARQDFSQIINQVTYGNQRIIVTKFGKPVAVISSIKNFDPQLSSNKNERNKDFQIIDQIQKQGEKLSASNASQLVKEALEEYKTK